MTQSFFCVDCNKPLSKTERENKTTLHKSCREERRRKRHNKISLNYYYKNHPSKNFNRGKN